MRPSGLASSRGWARPSSSGGASQGGAAVGADGRLSGGARRMSPLCVIFAVQVLAFVVLTLGAFTMFTTGRIEHAATVKELLRLRDEKSRLEGELSALRGAPADVARAVAPSAAAAAAASSMSAQLRDKLIGQCARATIEWWTYEVCPFQSARQFHTPDGKSASTDSFQLGSYAQGGVGSGSGAAPGGGGSATHLLTGGDLCANGQRRQARVSLVCGSGAAMVLASMHEVRPCEYSAVVALSAACSADERPYAPPAPKVAAERVGDAPERARPRSSGAPERASATVPSVSQTPAPPSRYASLPAGGTESIPDKAAAVVEVFQHSWAGYERYAWGKDEYQPLNKKAKADWIGLGLTAVSAAKRSRPDPCLGPLPRPGPCRPRVAARRALPPFSRPSPLTLLLRVCSFPHTKTKNNNNKNKNILKTGGLPLHHAPDGPARRVRAHRRLGRAERRVAARAAARRLLLRDHDPLPGRAALCV